MAYIDHANDPRRRATAIAGVLVVHTAIAAALVIGLTVSGYRQEQERMTAIPLPEPSAAPSPEPLPPEPTDPIDVLKAPLPPLPMPPRPGPTPDVFDPADELPTEVPRVPVPDPGPSVRATPTPPLPSPSFAPRRAAPAGNPARWISTDDYPARALRDEREGLAAYRLVVGSDGRVSACEITGSSGHVDLDRETCRLLERRARFEPATDEQGARVVGTYAGSVRWEIPD